MDSCLLLSAAAVQEARDEGDRETEFLAACTPGALYAYRAEPNEALGHYRFALAIALGHGMPIRAAECYHDLHLAAREAGNHSKAKSFFVTSLELHLDINPSNRRITGLLADEAETRFLVEPTLKNAHDALNGWRSVPGSLTGSRERFFAGCSLMVVAAWLGAGFAGRYKDGIKALEESLPKLTSHEGVAFGLAHAATGALRARDFPTAEQLVERAIRIAVERGETAVREKADEVRTAVLAERPVLAYT